MDFDNPRVSQFNYRSGDILIPEVKFAEPLRVEAEHFANCILNSLAGCGDCLDDSVCHRIGVSPLPLAR